MAHGQLSLKGRALRLLSGREHSRAELERKLAPHETEPGQLRRVLDELQAKDFINEQRVVDSRAAPPRAAAGRRAHPPGVAGQGTGADRPSPKRWHGCSRRSCSARARSGARSSPSSRRTPANAASRHAFSRREGSAAR